MSITDAVLVHGSFSSESSGPTWTCTGTQAWNHLRDRVDQRRHARGPGPGLATGNPGHHHDQAAKLRGRDDWSVVEIESGHNVLGERTEELVDLLLRIAGRRD